MRTNWKYCWTPKIHRPRRTRSRRDTRRARSARADVLVVALGRPGVELTRTPDAHGRIGDHFLPVGHPAHGARDREHDREHRARDSQRGIDDARIEIHVRVELSSDEVFVLESSLFE